MLQLLAEVSIAPGATDPDSWSHFFTAVGLPTGLLVLLSIFVSVCVYKALQWTIGSEGWITTNAKEANDAKIALMSEMRLSLGKLTTCFEGSREDLKDQKAYCLAAHGYGGPANVSDLRRAGHAAANVLGEIGLKIGANVSDYVAEIHNALNVGTADANEYAEKHP